MHRRSSKISNLSMQVIDLAGDIEQLMLYPILVFCQQNDDGEGAGELFRRLQEFSRSVGEAGRLFGRLENSMSSVVSGQTSWTALYDDKPVATYFKDCIVESEWVYNLERVYSLIDDVANLRRRSPALTASHEIVALRDIARDTLTRIKQIVDNLEEVEGENQ